MRTTGFAFRSRHRQELRRRQDNTFQRELTRHVERIIVRAVKVRDLTRVIQRDGWYLVRTRGSHRQYKHPVKPGLVTIPGRPGDDLALGTLKSILKQAGLKP